MKSLVLGYTLIELMLVIAIVGVLVSFGISAYTRAQARQQGVAAGETILALLNENQKLAGIGNKDCSGKYLGQQVTFALPNNLESRSRCDDAGSIVYGATKTTTIPGVTFDTSESIIFNPLALGIDLGSGSAGPLLFTYHTPLNLTYTIRLETSGTIEYLGAQ